MRHAFRAPSSGDIFKSHSSGGITVLSLLHILLERNILHRFTYKLSNSIDSLSLSSVSLCALCANTVRSDSFECGHFRFSANNNLKLHSLDAFAYIRRSTHASQRTSNTQSVLICALFSHHAYSIHKRCVCFATWGYCAFGVLLSMISCSCCGELRNERRNVRQWLIHVLCATPLNRIRKQLGFRFHSFYALSMHMLCA